MSSTGDLSSSSIGTANIHRVSNDMVDREFTAKALIGKDVYDNRDKKIGEVKDVVLTTTGAQELASALTSKASSHGSNSSMSSSGTTGTSSKSRAGETSSSGSMAANGSSGSTGATASTNSGLSTGSALSAFSSMTSEPAAIISFGGFMGVGNNLLHVPLSQLRYDSSRDHITLNVTETELSSLKDVSDTTRSATE